MVQKKSLVASELELAKRGFGAGHELALHDAIVLCHDMRWPLPRWALAELARRSRAFARGEKPVKKMGRHAVARTEQEQLLEDARCYDAVKKWRENSDRKLRGEDAFQAAADELHLSRETVRKAHYRHEKRLKKGHSYISWLYCRERDIVEYLQYNRELLG